MEILEFLSLRHAHLSVKTICKQNLFLEFVNSADFAQNATSRGY